MAPRSGPRAPTLAGMLVAPLIALLAAPAAPREIAEQSTPTLWRATRPDGRHAFSMIGSVHLGRPGMLVFPDAIDAAWERCDELVLEVSPSEIAGAGAGYAAGRYGLIDPPDTLHDRVSEETLAMFRRYLEERGESSLAPYLEIEPWALALQIVGREAERAGLDPRHGVDLHFAQRAMGRKPVVGLETALSQVEMLARLPRETQESLLLDTLLNIRDVRHGTEALVDAWARGDDAALEQIFYRPMQETPALSIYFEQLIFGRNESMTQRLASLARDGKLRFVVIGAGHMVGERGIPSLLRDYGFQVERVEKGGAP